VVYYVSENSDLLDRVARKSLGELHLAEAYSISYERLCMDVFFSRILPREVVVIDEEKSIYNAMEVIDENDLTGLGVVNNERRLVGSITCFDIITLGKILKFLQSK